jgi:hypothetical protein
MTPNPAAQAALSLAWLLYACVPARGAETRAAPIWQAGSGYRRAPVSFDSGGEAGFTLLGSQSTGVTFSNRLSEATVARCRLYEIGSGVALGDVDGDSWVDLYFCRLEGDNALFRNLGGWKFEDITAAAGVACPNQWSTGCALADIDGDGDLDLLVNSLGGGTRAFLNDGRGRFTETTGGGLFHRYGATSMALADADGDGDLELYVTNYRTNTLIDFPPGLKVDVAKRPDGGVMARPAERFIALPTRHGAPVVVERGEVDILYLNRGGGAFAPVPWHTGAFRDEDDQGLREPPTDWGLSVIFRDLNGDGLPDLYVCNDFVAWRDRIWLNQMGQRFAALDRAAMRHTSLSSMAVDVADINRDGHDDLFVADMLSRQRKSRAWQRPDTLKHALLPWSSDDPNARIEVPHNTLQLARGDGTYAEIAALAGLADTDWTSCAVFLDVDLDGWEDLLLSTGNLHDLQDLDAITRIGRGPGWRTPELRVEAFGMLPRRPAPSLAFRNQRDLTFEDASTRWRFKQTGIAHGMALGDLDQDGDLDVVVNCMNEPARIYRNDCPASRIGVRLKGASGNTRGIGARIRVTGGPVTQTQEMMAGGRFCSSDDPMRVFAAGQAGELEIHVTWRGGKTSVVTRARPNSIYEIDEAGAEDARAPSPPKPAPLFEDVSSRLKHIHRDEPFDDFARAPLLPRKLSTLGPGITWADVNGDGHDDLLIPGGKGGRAALFKNDGRGGFAEWVDTPFPRLNSRDQAALIAFAPGDGPARFCIGESNWEDDAPHAPPFRAFALPPDPGATTRPVLPELSDGAFCPGPMAGADVNGDGRLDLFLGGRARPGRYPEPAPAYLLFGDEDGFRLAQSFPSLGLISAAVFVDFNGDGRPDLAVAGEWEPIRLFRNDHGRLSEVTRSFGLENTGGFWNGITAGDFDGDGRPDLAASNWGRNWRIDQPLDARGPVRLIYGDFNEDGALQTLLVSADSDLGKETPWRERSVVAAAIPAVATRAPDYHHYGRSGARELLGGGASKARELEAAVFESMIFLNRGDHFEPRPLPVQAQFAAAFGVSVADFNGDGNEDLFLAQNFFGVDPETTRQDAGIGLVLLGDGRGAFQALGPLESGISIPGEQRGSAVTDFDGDGRPDLAVGQHNGPTRLFRNRAGKPGVRVALRGGRGNPAAVGATVRLLFGERAGPLREVRAGGGYWSQDSTTLLLAAPETPTGLELQWPGGGRQRLAWPAGAKCVAVSTGGVSEQ